MFNKVIMLTLLTAGACIGTQAVIINEKNRENRKLKKALSHELYKSDLLHRAGFEMLKACGGSIELSADMVNEIEFYAIMHNNEML